MTTHLYVIVNSTIGAIDCIHDRPTHVSHPTLEAIVTEMRTAGRNELVHYAGACYHDDIAWQVTTAWLSDRAATEAVLKARAAAASGW